MHVETVATPPFWWSRVGSGHTTETVDFIISGCHRLAVLLDVRTERLSRVA